jgi:hypothetical protein
MNKNLILYAIGGFFAYMLLRPKKSNAMATPSDASTTSEEQVPESNVIQGTFVQGGVPITQVTTLTSPPKKPLRSKKELFEWKRQNQNPSKRPSLFGIEVPKVFSNIPDLKDEPIRTKTQYVYYANLQRLTPMEQMTPVRYKERTLGTIYVSDIDENNNMTWRNEATNQIVTIIYPTR